MDTPFSDLGLPTPLREAIESLGFERPSPIQVAAIPPALEGKDLVGLSETGSGKTAAFALPALARIDLEHATPQVLILCPTRELAVQVCEEVHRLGKNLPGLHAIPVYGGAPIDRQLRSLKKGVHLVVGTPGRLLDHLRRKSFHPGDVHTVVLDEADRMLDMGFRDEMEELVGAMPTDRQTLFFSATMNPGVSRFIQQFGRDPQTIETERKTLTVELIDQVCYEVRQRSKLEVLSRLLDMEAPRLAIVFCNTKRGVDECTEALLARGYSADRLHGDITQNLRERVLRRFREGTIELLVATDVAARGLDIDDVDIVFNYDLPQDPEDYVHRIGRTGRAGKKGRAISFVFGRDIYRLKTIERYTRQPIPRAQIPSQEEVEGSMADQLFGVVHERLEEGQLDDCSELLQRLLEQGHSASDVASALFAILRDTTGREGESIVEDNPNKKHKHKHKHKREREPGPGDKPQRRERKPERGDERSERRDHSEHHPKKGRFDTKPANSGGESSGKARLFLSLGTEDGVMPKAIAGMLYREADLPNGSLGQIKLFPKHTIIEIRADLAEDAIEAARSAKLRGKRFRLDHDRKD